MKTRAKSYGFLLSPVDAIISSLPIPWLTSNQHKPDYLLTIPPASCIGLHTYSGLCPHPEFLASNRVWPTNNNQYTFAD